MTPTTSAASVSVGAATFVRCNRERSRPMRDQADKGDLDILIETGITDPIAIGLAENLLQEAGIPFFAMDRNVAARQESGNFLGWWNVRVPRELEAEAREILHTEEEMK